MLLPVWARKQTHSRVYASQGLVWTEMTSLPSARPHTKTAAAVVCNPGPTWNGSGKRSGIPCFLVSDRHDRALSIL